MSHELQAKESKITNLEKTTNLLKQTTNSNDSQQQQQPEVNNFNQVLNNTINSAKEIESEITELENQTTLQQQQTIQLAKESAQKQQQSQTEIQQLEQKIERIDREVEELERKLRETKQQQQNASNQLAKMQNKHTNILKENERVEHEKQQTERATTKAKERMTESKRRISNVLRQLDDLKSFIAKIENEICHVGFFFFVFFLFVFVTDSFSSFFCFCFFQQTTQTNRHKNVHKNKWNRFWNPFHINKSFFVPSIWSTFTRFSWLKIWLLTWLQPTQNSLRQPHNLWKHQLAQQWHLVKLECWLSLLKWSNNVVWLKKFFQISKQQHLRAINQQMNLHEIGQLNKQHKVWWQVFLKKWEELYLNQSERITSMELFLWLSRMKTGICWVEIWVVVNVWNCWSLQNKSVQYFLIFLFVVFWLLLFVTQISLLFSDSTIHWSKKCCYARIRCCKIVSHFLLFLFLWLFILFVFNFPVEWQEMRRKLEESCKREESQRKLEEAQRKREESQRKLEESQRKLEESQRKLEESQRKLEESQRKREETETRWSCVVCFEPCQTALEPCGHLCCERCVGSLPNRQCPTCRQPINGTLRLFTNWATTRRTHSVVNLSFFFFFFFFPFFCGSRAINKGSFQHPNQIFTLCCESCPFTSMVLPQIKQHK